MFKLASLFVEIKADDSALKAQVSGVQSQLTGFGVAIGTAVGNLASSAISAASSALAGFFARGITGASDLGESLSKVGVTFGDQASVVMKMVDMMADKFGAVKGPVLEAAANFGQIFKGVQMGIGPAAAMSAQLVKLAADAASFHNVPLDVALEKIRAGLTGQAEPLLAFGVVLTEEKVALEAVALGLAKNTRHIDDQAKVAARASLINKGLADVQGDLERTADSTSNQWKKLTGTMTNMAVELGTALMPAINSLLNATTAFIGYAKPGFESLKETFASWSASVVEAVNTIGVVWRNLGDEWQIVRIKASEMFTNLLEIFGTIPANLAIIGEYIANNWVQLISDGVAAVGTIFLNLGSNIQKLGVAIVNFLADPTAGFSFEWTPLLDGFRATADALPELIKPALTSMQGEIDAVAQRIGDREGKRAEAMQAKAKATAAAGAATAKAAAGKQDDFKSQTVGVAEFRSKLQESIFSKEDTTAKKTLAAGERTAKAAEDTAEQLKKGVPAILS